MKNVGLLFAAILGGGLLGMVAYQCAGTQQVEQEDYASWLQDYRAEKDAYMAADPASPFVQSQEPAEPLHYFPGDEAYKVEATLKPLPVPEPVTVHTSTGHDRRYLKWGHAHFTLKGEECKLLLLDANEEGATDKSLFLAFTDSTSARSSYGGGRYLDLPWPEGETITIDFNLAYNPYCAYLPDYSCPIPPAENNLSIAVEAGEKTYGH